MQTLVSIAAAGSQSQQALDFGTPAADKQVALTPEVETLLAVNCVVAVGVSGGKDSVACALAVDQHLNQIGHTGPRLLIHADLGLVEWRDSLPSCERLAARIGWELIVVRRNAGDMLARWQGRWANNVGRYRDLSCVKLILPWSIPSMRFCTSELKVAAIASALKKRYPGLDILNVAGIRRQESASRRRMPVSAPMPRLQTKSAAGLSWNAIIEWSLKDVLATISDSGLALHDAYTRYGASRVSCIYCIRSSESDLMSAAGCEDNHDIYRQMVELEAVSSFGFQSTRWLADVSPALLSPDLLDRIEEAKAKAIQREFIEAELPTHLLFTDGWPTLMPSENEAELIASVRRRVSNLVGFEAKCITAESVLGRYAQLMAERKYPLLVKS